MNEKTRHYKLIRENSELEESLVDYFAANANIACQEDFRLAVQSTIDEFLASEKVAGQVFNMEELLECIPEALWEKHGLKYLDDIPYILMDDLQLFGARTTE